MRAVAIVDGEHYPPVVADAIAELPYDVVAAVLVGGIEKLRGGAHYGVPVHAELEDALARFAPEVVVDLSDEPVLGPVDRLALASRVLAHGLPYVGADFRLDPPTFAPFELPSIAVIGTGKRVGKTAVTGHLARLASAERRLVVVAMGRGGPREPETILVPPTVEALVELSRAGRHAASDHLETAALTGVATIGCRRCGGGLAGDVFVSNVEAGARAAVALEPELVVFDGSGAAIPPVDVRKRLLVVGGTQSPAVAAGYLNTYRLLIADLVVVTMAEAEAPWEAVREAARAVVRPGVEVVATVLRPRPLRDLRGRRVAYFCTAPPSAHAVLAAHLEERHGLSVAHVSGSLADRETLRRELEAIDAEAFLVELKAAAVDVVAETGQARGVEVVLAANDVVALPGEPDLDGMLLDMARILP
ncbi:MAG: 2,3-diphosphoglycerate synthetase [Gaiellaceae bacterium]|nr:MAG: 2,3-diphosphoglycerate synthetase [Gaiellaceae bacterium]